MPVGKEPRRETPDTRTEMAMDIVYAAEKLSIASLLSEYTHICVQPADIKVTENPDETGSFYVGWDRNRYLLSPGGRIRAVKKREI